MKEREDMAGESEGNRRGGMEGESQAGAPWHQRRAGLTGGAKLLELPPSGSAGKDCPAPSAAHISQGSLHSPDSIIVPLAAAPRSKHKRATML